MHNYLFALDEAKIGLYCFVAAIVVATAHVAYNGLRLGATLPYRYDPQVLQTHQDGARGLMWLMGTFIITIEFAIHTYHLNYGALFWWHLPFAATWGVVFLAMTLHLNGKRYPVLHRRLAYLGLGCAAVASTLGTIMIIAA